MSTSEEAKKLWLNAQELTDFISKLQLVHSVENDLAVVDVVLKLVEIKGMAKELLERAEREAEERQGVYESHKAAMEAGTDISEEK